MTGKNKLQLVLKIIGIVLGFSVIGFFAITLAYTLPRGRIRNHVAEDVTYYTQYHSWANRLWATRDDAYSDAFILSITAGPNEDPVRSAALSLRNQPIVEAEDIFQEINVTYGENRSAIETKESPYARYWHGYVTFLAPLLVFLSPAEITLLNYGIQFFLIIAIILVAYKKYGSKLALAIAFYIYALNPATTAMSFQYAPGFYLSIIPMLLILMLNDKLQKNGRYLLLFTLIGCLINYLDLLSYPLVTLGGPLALSMYLDKTKVIEKKDCVKQIMRIVMRSACWVCGYALTWVMKWAIATLVTGENIFASALSAIALRSSGGGYRRSEAIIRNIDTMFNAGTIAVCIILVVLLLVLWWRKKITLRLNWANMIILGLIALYPFVWYCTLVNHSWIHTFMTHRLLAISMFCAALFVAKTASRVPSKKMEKKLKAK